MAESDKKNKNVRQNSKEAYRIRIDNNPIFSLKDEKNSSDYKIYKNQLMEDIYCYLADNDYSCVAKGKPKYTDFADTIIETIIRCLDSFNPDINTSFLGFFEACWTNEYNKNVRNAIIKDQYMELGFTEADKRLMSSFAKSYAGMPLKVDEKIKTFANDKGITIEKAEDIYMIHCNQTIGDTVTGDDDEALSILDSIATPGSDPYELVDQIDAEERIVRLFSIIEDKYSGLRVDKTIGSAVITNMMADYLLYYYHRMDSFSDIALKYTFFNKEIFEYIRVSNSQMEWRTLAQVYEKLPAAVSRAKANIEKNVFSEGLREFLISIDVEL